MKKGPSRYKQQLNIANKNIHSKIAYNVSVGVLYMVTKIGITAGVHRLWTHRSYKANFPLRMILMFFFTLAFEVFIYMLSDM